MQNDLLEINIWIDKLKKYCILKNFAEDYKLIETIGKGAFSAVYKAKSMMTGEYFAVKVMKKSAHELKLSVIKIIDVI